MIYFKNLEAEGAFSFGKVIVPLANQGMTLITGANLDDFEGSVGVGASGSSANGAGKSSLMDIITHGLFANTGRGVRKNGIINSFHAPGYFSKLTFAVGADEYSYLQSRSHAVHGTTNNFEKSGKALGIKGLDETQLAVQNVLGLTLEDWTATTYLAQGVKHLFVRTDGNDLKKQMLARIFSLDYKYQLEKAKASLESTRVSLITLKSSISSTKTQLIGQIAVLPLQDEADYEKKIEELSNTIQTISDKITDFELKLQTHHNAKVAKQTKENYANHLKDLFVGMGIWAGTLPTPADFLTYIKGQEASLTQVQGQLQEATKYVEALLKRDTALTQYRTWEGTEELKAVVNLQILEDELSAAQDSSMKLQGKYNGGKVFTEFENLRQYEVVSIPSVQDMISKIEGKIIDAQSKVNSLWARVEEEERNWKKIETGVCYACERPYPVDQLDAAKKRLGDAKEFHKLALNELQKLKDDSKDAIDSLKDNLQHKREYDSVKTRISPEHLEWKLIDYQEELRRLNERVTKLKKFITDVKQAKQAYEASMAYQGLDGDTVQYTKFKTDLEESQNKFVEFIASLKSVANTLKSWDDILIPECEDIDEVMMKGQLGNFRTVNEENSNILAVWNRDYQLFKDYNAQLAKIMEKESEIDLLEKNEQIYNALTYSFGPKGLIVSRLEIICKHLTERVNYFISRILKENIHIQFVMDGDSLDLIIHVNGKERSVGNFSGGELAKIGLACMFGLRSLLPDRYQTNLLILDEAESNLDERVRYELVDILQYLLQSTNLDSIFVISHSTAIQEMQIWTTRFHCIKEKGISTLEILTA